MNFQQLEYAVAVSRYSSMNKAAQALFVTQPTLSSAIKELEAEIGFSIFVRSKAGISITPEGRKFLRSAQIILEQMAQMRMLYASRNLEDTCPILRISTGRYSFISRALSNFYQNYLDGRQRFSVYVEENGCHEVAQDVLYRRADVGIIHVRDAEQPGWKRNLETHGLAYDYLFSTASCVVFRKDHPLAAIEKLKIEDIYRYPQIRTTSRGAEYCNYDSMPSFYLYEEFERNIYTNSRCLLYDLLNNTNLIFLGVTPLFLTKYHPELVTRPLPGEEVRWSFFSIRLKGTACNPYALSFIRILQQTTEQECQLKKEVGK